MTSDMASRGLLRRESKTPLQLGPSLLFTLLLTAPLASGAKAPAPVTDLEVSPATTGVLLTWKYPPSASVLRIVVRYRTDGVCPATPVDGLLAFDAQGATGAFEHRDARTDLPCCYSVFVIDAVGNVSPPASALADPVHPPGVVKNVRRTDP
jgi:hypothetical protein